MGLPARQLAPGEHLVLSVRTHWKALVGPVFLLFFVAALAGFGAAVLPAGKYHHDGELALLLVAVLLVLRLTVWPFLQWLFESFTITDRRLAHRAGVVRRTGRDLPLSRVADVSYDRSLWDRLFRCGTLVVQTAGETGDIVFDDVPHVDEFEMALTELCYGPDPDGRFAGGSRGYGSGDYRPEDDGGFAGRGHPGGDHRGDGRGGDYPGGGYRGGGYRGGDYRGGDYRGGDDSAGGSGAPPVSRKTHRR